MTFFIFTGLIFVAALIINDLMDEEKDPCCQGECQFARETGIKCIGRCHYK